MSNGIYNEFESAFDAISPEKAKALGFRFGERGTHTSRTVMFAELEMLLSAVPGNVTRDEYAKAVIDDNCLIKRTVATRRLSFQRLSELYGFNPTIPLFRVLRDLWPRYEESRPILAVSTALARDPLLRITAAPILSTPIGEDLSRRRLENTLTEAVDNRFNESILDKIVRNASSSWTQSGHLRGRIRKVRQRVQPTPAACAFILLIGYMLGQRGRLLFETPWARVLDAVPVDLIDQSVNAKRIGLLDLKQSGDIIDVSFPDLLTPQEQELVHGTD